MEELFLSFMVPLASGMSDCFVAPDNIGDFSQ
jgi:hypothetical protein